MTKANWKNKARELENILHHIGEGVVVFGNDGLINFANHAAVEISGWKYEDFIGHAIHDHGLLRLAGGREEGARPALFEVTLDGQAEETFQRKDGSAFPVECKVAPLVEDGGTGGATLVFRDISIRKAAFNEIKARTAELERSNKELEQFAFVASHDMKSPLTSLGGFLGLIENVWGGEMPAKAREYLGLALKSARELDALINDTLEISRFGYCGANMGMVSLKTALEAALWNLKGEVEKSGAVASYPDEMPVAKVDHGAITRLFQNLIGNSIKYRTPSKAPEISVSFESAGNEWRFVVRDNGIGVAPEDRPHIFDVFRRGGAVKGINGTGVGLAICKKIVDRHGGRIWVEGHEEGGSSFFFTLAKDGEAGSP